MFELSTLVLFVAASLAFLLIPGPAILYIVTRSVDQGRTAGLVSVAGIQAGALVHVFAAAFGVSALLATSAAAFSLVKYLGAAYLIYLGVMRILEGKAVSRAKHPQPKSHGVLFREGMIVNILNPKTALFFLAFLPQFANPAAGNMVTQILVLGSINIALAMICDGMWALASSSAATWLRQTSSLVRFQNYFSGGILVGLGLLTALSGAKNK